MCETCGNAFRIRPAKVKHGAAFCGKDCYNKSGRANGRVPNAIENRFWPKVRKTDTCWLWVAGRDENGYGRISRTRGQGPILAHRLSFKIHNGFLPDDLAIRHKCDNPPCVNPEHLELGTQLDNIADSVKRGRTTFGERQPASRLKAAAIPTIRQRYATEKISYKMLAVEYGVGPSTIADVIVRRTWSHIP